MAIDEKTFGKITFGNEVEILENNRSYSIPIWDEEFKAEFLLHIPTSVIEIEFKARGLFVTSSYYWQNDEKEHMLTFEEFEVDPDFRDDFDKLVQDIAIDVFYMRGVASRF